MWLFFIKIWVEIVIFNTIQPIFSHFFIKISKRSSNEHKYIIVNKGHFYVMFRHSEGGNPTGWVTFLSYNHFYWYSLYRILWLPWDQSKIVTTSNNCRKAIREKCWLTFWLWLCSNFGEILEVDFNQWPCLMLHFQFIIP